MLPNTDFIVWGNNQGNLISRSNLKCLPTPTSINLPFSISSICASEKHISFITKDGNLYSFGSNLDGRLGVSLQTLEKASYDDPVRVPIKGKVIKVESGFSHVCALTDNLELYAWGLGEYGALGTGQFRTKSTPTPVDLPKDIIANLRQFSCGAMHTAYVTEKGDVYMCGSNQYGELGVTRPEKVASPIHISFHLTVKQISCGVFYTLLLTNQGRVYGMGNNKYGQLGLGHKANESHPTLLRDLQGIVKVTAGYHSGAIDHIGNLYIWGSGSFGEILKPKKIILSVPIRDIAIRGFFGLAIGHTSKLQNRIYTWGNNTFGELGVGTYEAAQQPQQIEALRGKQIGKIALGANFVMLVLHSSNKLSDFPLYSSPRIFQRSNNLLSDRKQITNFDDVYVHSHKSQRRSKSRDIYQKSYNPTPVRQTSAIQISQGFQKNYQQLFLSLSGDYEYLLQKYQLLEKKLQQTQPQQNPSINQAIYQMDNENKQLNQIISKLEYELSAAKEDYLYKLESLRKDKDTLLIDFEALSKQKFTVQPDPITINRSLNQLEIKYSKILNEKQQAITNLTIQSSKVEQELRNMVSKLRTQKLQIQNNLQQQIEKNSLTFKQNMKKFTTAEESYKNKEKRLLDQFIGKTDTLSEKLQKQQNKSQLLDEQLTSIKKRSILQEDNIKKFEMLNLQLENQLLESQKRNKQFSQQILNKNILLDRIDNQEIQLNYQKQYNKKYQTTVYQLQQMRQKLYRELQAEVDLNKSSQIKIEQLKNEVDVFRKFQKEANEKSIQIQEFQEIFDNFKDKTSAIISDKEKIIQQLQQYIQKSHRQQKKQIDNKNQQISDLNNTTAKLQKQINKNKDTIAGSKQQLLLKDEELEHISQTRNALQKKTTFLQQELKKETEDRQALAIQVGQSKREVSKLKITLSQRNSQIQSQKQKSDKLAAQLYKIQQDMRTLAQQLDTLKQKQLNLRKQNNSYRDQVQKLTNQLQKQVHMNQQLITANKQFAGSQQKFIEQISELENRIRQLESENQSYTPRYQALLLRNQQLDERNRELGEMVNKAIEIQAESYKTNILKQVELNTDQFLNDVEDEQQFKNMHKRNKKELQDEQEDIEFQTPKMNIEKQEPYTRVMKQRISSHKRKISESAHKLASLLDINEGKSQNYTSRNSRRNEDYQRVNLGMQSFNNHKEEFVSKIHSFAEKLKIL